MDDCRLTVTIRDGVVHFESADIGMEDIASISGYLQVFVATEALKNGLDMDEVKNNMLDLHLAAMETVEELWRKGGGEDGKV